jgi:hypothetical protein
MEAQGKDETSKVGLRLMNSLVYEVSSSVFARGPPRSMNISLFHPRPW